MCNRLLDLALVGFLAAVCVLWLFDGVSMALYVGSLSGFRWPPNLGWLLRMAGLWAVVWFPLCVLADWIVRRLPAVSTPGGRALRTFSVVAVVFGAVAGGVAALVLHSAASALAAGALVGAGYGLPMAIREGFRAIRRGCDRPPLPGSFRGEAP